MRKWTLLTCLLTASLPILSSAAKVRQVVTLSAGSDRANVSMTKTIMMITPFQNAYISSNHYDTQAVVGIFVGGETLFRADWAAQLGAGYYQSSAFNAKGNVNQFADPAFNNLTYQYHIQSKRFLIETKLLRTLQQKWHPYVTVGLGASYNMAYAYTEAPISSDDVPMTQPFNSHTTKSFTYTAGLGMDVDLGDNVRAGVGYRFVNLGNASLGTTPLQDGTNTISHSNIHANEFLAQVSFLS